MADNARISIHIAESDPSGALNITFPSGQEAFVYPHGDKWQGFVRFGANKSPTALFGNREDATSAIINHVRAHLQRDLLSADVFLGGNQLHWQKDVQPLDDGNYEEYTLNLMSGAELRVIEDGDCWYGEAYQTPANENPIIITDMHPTCQAAQLAVLKQYIERLHGDANQLRGNE